MRKKKLPRKGSGRRNHEPDRAEHEHVVLHGASPSTDRERRFHCRKQELIFAIAQACASRAGHLRGQGAGNPAGRLPGFAFSPVEYMPGRTTFMYPLPDSAFLSAQRATWFPGRFGLPRKGALLRADFLHLEQRGASPFTRRPDLPETTSRAQIETPNLGGGYINVVRTGHVARRGERKKP